MSIHSSLLHLLYTIQYDYPTVDSDSTLKIEESGVPRVNTPWGGKRWEMVEPHPKILNT